jgi:hypothetical protein
VDRDPQVAWLPRIRAVFLPLAARFNRCMAAVSLGLVLSLFVTRAAASHTSPSRHAGAPPVVICGHTLFNGGRRPRPETVGLSSLFYGRTELRLGVRYVLEFTESCSSGVGEGVAVEPRGALTVEARARAEDGRTAALLVTARRPGLARITVSGFAGGPMIFVVHVRQRPNPDCVHSGTEPPQATRNPVTRYYTGFIVGGTGSFVGTCGEVAIALTTSPVNPGPEYLVQMSVRGARCPRHRTRTISHPRCLRLFANISGRASRVSNHIPDTPGKVQITSALGESNVLGAVTVVGAFTGTGFIYRGARHVWLALKGALGTITIGGNGPPIEGFQAP